MLRSMNALHPRLLPIYVLVAAVEACAARQAPHALLPDRSPMLTELTAQYPLAAGQSVRAERLGATTNLSYHLVQIAPGAGERLHIHAQHDLVVTLLRGVGTQRIRDELLPLKAGDSAVIPAGTPHRFVNTGNEVSAAFVIFSPPFDGSDQIFLDTP